MAAGKVKLTRKEVKAPDEFMNWMGKAFDFFKVWGRWIVGGLVLLIVVIFGAILLSRHSDSRKIEASTAFHKAFSPVVAAQAAVPAGDDEAAPEDVLKTRADAQVKFSDAVKTLDTFATGHKGTPLASLALLGKASAALHAGQFEPALEAYRAYLAADPQAVWAPMVWESMGYAADAAGKRDEAVKAFSEMGRAPSALVRGTAYLHLGDLFNPALRMKAEDVVDAPKAREYYDKALQELAGEDRAMPRLAGLTRKLVEERLVTLR